jgi:NOL1/NOP2/fmu family ribosome biogenesis protein
MIKYMQGEVLMKSCPKGFTGLSYNGHLLGFGKSDGSMIKNKLPKGLRQR